MKIQLTQEYTDEFGRTFDAGNIVEFDQPTRERLVAEGKAIEMPPGTKGSISGFASMACVESFATPEISKKNSQK